MNKNNSDETSIEQWSRFQKLGGVFFAAILQVLSLTFVVVVVVLLGYVSQR